MTKKIIFIFMTLSLLLSACTPAEETPPPLTGDDIQATAISMAWTMAVQTMEAMPTATFTPLPPTATFTPAFTATPIFSPTPLFTPTPLATATKDGEIKMLYAWEGDSTRLLFVNNTKGTATISLYLSEGSNARGYYGYIPVPVLQKNGSAVISAPKQGYYYVFAWMAEGDTKKSIQGNFGTNNPDKHEVHLSMNGVKIIGP